MPRLQPLDPRSDPSWDADLHSFPQATFFHSSAWCSVLCSTYGFTPLYLRLRQGDTTTALLPLLEVSSLLTGRRGVSLPFTDTCDPLFHDPSHLDSLWKEALSLATTRKWRSLELRSSDFPSASAPLSCQFHGHLLDLTLPREKREAAYDQSLRRSLRKAAKSALKIEISSSLDALHAYYRLHCLTRQHHGLPPQSLGFFENLHAQSLAKRIGCIVLARLEGKAVAGALFLSHQDKALYKFGASDRNYLELRPNQLVMHEAINMLADKGFTTLDFGRTSLSNTGLREYKLRWGTRETPLGYHRFDLNKKHFCADSDRASGLHTRIFNHLPIPLSRLLGQLLYRHMA